MPKHPLNGMGKDTMIEGGREESMVGEVEAFDERRPNVIKSSFVCLYVVGGQLHIN